jgi:hypothetical protein
MRDESEEDDFHLCVEEEEDCEEQQADMEELTPRFPTHTHVLSNPIIFTVTATPLFSPASSSSLAIFRKVSSKCNFSGRNYLIYLKN